MRIYLGGPINGCSDAEAGAWRAEACRLLVGHEVLDPMRRDYRGKEADNVAAIVEGDKHDIESADVLVMHCPKPSVGTSMETFYGWFLGKHVIVIAAEPVSPWLRYHSAEVCASLADAVHLISGLRVE